MTNRSGRFKMKIVSRCRDQWERPYSGRRVWKVKRRFRMETQTYTRIICVVVCLASSCVSQVQSQEQATRSGPGSFVAIQGAKLYYEECGSASQTLVLIHDGVVNSSVWDDVWPEFCS